MRASPRRTARACWTTLAAGGRQAALLALPAGEAMKTLAGAERAYDWLIEQGTERGDVLVASAAA